jgi:hypothetical protein
MKYTWLVALLLVCSCHKTFNTTAPPMIAPSFTSTLNNLAMPHDGMPMHEGSWDRSGGNGDARPVKPGETLTLLDHRGAGIIRRFWVTIAPRAEMHIHRQAILRMYWDDETEPSVEAPIGDFFGVGFGEQKDFISLPLNETSGGYNCYWPMPFHKSARWTITNMSDRNIDAFYYNIDFTGYESLPADLRHFHAQWHRENPTDPSHNYTILETEGEGHFVGVAMFMQARRPRGLGFLEGDEVVYVDQPEALLKIRDRGPTTRTVDQAHQKNKPSPQIIGTGTEDYFSSGWYFDRGTYSAPFHGCVIKDELKNRVSAYRWHIEDAMPFHKCIRVSIEHGTNNDHEADYSSVAYWYQTPSSRAGKRFSSIPIDARELLPYTPPAAKKFKDAIEAESLVASAKASGGQVHVQPMGTFVGEWSGEAQLFWTDAHKDDSLTLKVPAPEDGEYELAVWFTAAPDYAIVQPVFNDKPLGEGSDLYWPTVKSNVPMPLGRIALKKGDNSLTFKIIGKNEKSTNYFVGIDALRLKRAQ